MGWERCGEGVDGGMREWEGGGVGGGTFAIGAQSTNAEVNRRKNLVLRVGECVRRERQLNFVIWL